MINMSALCAPFPPRLISWRVGSTTGDKKKGMALAYLDARAVMERLDGVVGPANWQCRYPHANGKTVCEIGIKVLHREGGNLDEGWIWKADGAGDTDFEAEKGALSDAFKRAAVRWGIGRYLYEIDAPWVEIEPMGKSFRIADSQLPKLNALLKFHFVTECQKLIASFRDHEALGAWWNSDEQKELRRSFEMDPSEVNKLKDSVLEKREQLNPKGKAA